MHTNYLIHLTLGGRVNSLSVKCRLELSELFLVNTAGKGEKIVTLQWGTQRAAPIKD